jgi:predicted ester cyclase
VDPKTVVKEFWAGYNRDNLEETWKTYVTEDVLFHPTSGVELVPGDSWLSLEKTVFAVFEAVDAKVLDQVAEGDMVAYRWSLTARQTAEFMGVPSRGRTATCTGMFFDRIRDNKIAEHWASLQFPHFLQAPSGE